MSNHVKQITARFRVTTPLFAGGATPQRAELRAASFKGLLRFWWRALPEQACLSSAELARAEAALFGSARLRQSTVRLRLEVPREPMPLTPPTRLNRNGSGAGNDKDLIGTGARYLGYGLIQAFRVEKQDTGQVLQAGELQRPCFPAPLELSLHVHLLPGVSDKQAEQVESALILMGTLGGLGSRARRGFGSLSLVELTREDEAKWPPNKAQAFEHAFPDWLRARYEKSEETLPEWTAISRHARILLLRKESPESAVSLLDRIGKEMVRYRSWGATKLGTNGRGKILDSELSEQNFKPDHDLMKKDPSKRDAHPARIAFGLPHDYGKKDRDKVGPAERGLDRRASPLFLHIHQTDAQTPPIAVVSFLPARFLPGEKPEIWVGGTNVEMLPESELYEPVRRFLMRLAGEERDELRGSKPKDPFKVIARIGVRDGGQP